MNLKEELGFDGNKDEVWKRASDVKNIPRYWHGTSTLKVLKVDGSATFALNRFAFNASGHSAIVVDARKRVVTITHIDGPLKGVNLEITVNDRVIRALWTIATDASPLAKSEWHEGHFRKGTKHALQRLVNGENRATQALQTRLRTSPH